MVNLTVTLLVAVGLVAAMIGNPLAWAPFWEFTIVWGLRLMTSRKAVIHAVLRERHDGWDVDRNGGNNEFVVRITRYGRRGKPQFVPWWVRAIYCATAILHIFSKQRLPKDKKQEPRQFDTERLVSRLLNSYWNPLPYRRATLVR